MFNDFEYSINEYFDYKDSYGEYGEDPYLED